MQGHQKAGVLVGLIWALVFAAFIGGCTVVGTSNNAKNSMIACIESGMEWRGGDCVRPDNG